MKIIITVLLTLTLISCNQQKDQITKLQNQIDSLENKLANTYKPGFGKLMSGVQNHHSKLWFAGINKNWKLADFEVHEIIELLDDVKKYQSARKESENIEMINPVLDSLRSTVKNKDLNLFKDTYKRLTNTCNDCHKITEFEFNIVKVPTRPAFSNQKFRN